MTSSGEGSIASFSLSLAVRTRRLRGLIGEDGLLAPREEGRRGRRSGSKVEAVPP